MGPLNNVVSRIMTGNRYQHDDPELRKLTGIIMKYFDHINFTKPFNLLQLNCVPFAR